MVQTKDGVGTNPWIEFVRECAKEYKSTTQPAKEHAKGGQNTKHANGAKHGKGTASKEQRTVEEWENRKQDVNKKQSQANMKRSGEIAQKVEQDHLVRKRITTKQKENHSVRKRLTSKQKDPNSSI